MEKLAISNPTILDKILNKYHKKTHGSIMGITKNFARKKQNKISTIELSYHLQKLKLFQKQNSIISLRKNY